MDTIQILLTTLALTALVALLVLAFAGRSPTKEAARRMQALRFRHSDNAIDRVEAQIRKAVAARHPKAHRIAGSGSRREALHLRLHRTGKGWTLTQYIYFSIGLAVIILGLVLLKTGSLLLAAGVGLIVGLGLPHMVVGKMISRRANQFTVRFPDAIELLVRGLRSGLPVSETLGIVSTEIPGPVSEEFKLVTERMRIGRTMEDALQDTADRLNMAEFNFFCITLAIQRETGGNLAETLANLADVLRKRAQMKLKIRAMSSESKASAYIIGALPFLVFALVYWSDPDYLGGFFHDERLIGIGLGGLVWMGIGVFIMAKMINFEI
ncbi:MAG: type II secretion system F family protein [Sphingomonadales bacterium]|nr:type II secretion system F family protein [Sphingomonadales bacterium]